MDHPDLAPGPFSIAVLAHLHHPIAEPFQGGLEAHTAQVCRALAQRGHRVTLFAKQGSRVPGVEVVEVLGAGFRWTPGSSEGDDARLDEATATSCRLAVGHDVVLNNCLNPVPYQAMGDAAMLTMLHTPATLRRVNRVVASPGWAPGPRHAWLSVSHANAEGWRRVLGVPVGVVHNGIELGRWTPGRQPTRPLVWAARITPEKGLHVALDAAERLGQPLAVAGPVSDQGYFNEQIAPRLARHAAAGLASGHVGHLPHDRLAALLAEARVFLATPLWEEPFGLAPLEAMACGTPVAALGRGALPELLGGDGGAVAQDPDGLPAAVLRAATLDRAAVRRRAEQFSMAAMVSGYESVLARLAGLAG